MSWVQEAERERDRVFEFMIWLYTQAWHGLVWVWQQTPAAWDWWWRAALILGTLIFGPRLIRFAVSRLWEALRGVPGVLGAARFASLRELRKAGLLRPGGRFLGRVRGRDVFLHGEGHCLTIAAQGSGKTTGLIIPTLITYGGTVVVTDPKGAITAQTRRLREQRGRVVVLNPWGAELAGDSAFNLDLGDDGFNPLQLVGLDPEGRSAAATLAGLVLPDMPGEESYWKQEARELLEWGMLYLAAYEPRALMLPRLHALIYDTAGLLDTLERMAKANHPPVRQAIGTIAAKFYGMMAAGAGQQFVGVQGSASTALKIYADGYRLAEHVRKPGGFRLADLKGDEPLTIYLICPPGHLVSDDRKWLNLVLALIMQQVGKPGAARETVLLMDEFPALGYLPNLFPSLEQFREAGLRGHLIAQNPGQVMQLYGQDGLRRLWGIAEYKQFFRITDPEHAKLLSDWLGNRTVRTQTRNPRGEISDSLTSVPLIRPEELTGMARGRQIILRPESRPAFGHVVPFFKRREWAAAVDPNPYRGG